MTIYQLTDRPRRGRAVQQRGDRIVATVPAWSAELGAHSPSVEYLAPLGPPATGDLPCSRLPAARPPRGGRPETT